jgi:2'-5' RNA ligase
MRAFIAIDFSEDIKEYLAEVQKQLPKGKLRLARDFHLTLKFLGEIPPDKVERTKQLLEKVRLKKFVVETASIGVFPSENYIRVVWLGLEPEEPVLQLQQQIEDVLANEFKRERGFKAHITLARVKYIDDKKEFLKQLKKIKTAKIRVVIDKFKLKKSTLTEKGAIYEDLAVFTPQSL